MLFKKFFLMLFLALLLPASFALSQTWTKVDNGYSTVHKIFFPRNNPDWVALASDAIPIDLDEQTISFYPIDGKGYLLSKDKGITFTDTLLKNYFVYEIFQDPTTPSTWLASVRHRIQGAGILVSSDNGSSWQTNKLKCIGSFQILKIVAKPYNPTLLFAAVVNTDKGFRYSEKNFEDCNSTSNISIQSRDIAISPVDTSLMFIAGDGTYQSGVFRSNDNGASWQKEVSGLQGLRIHCLLPSSFSSAVVFCGADSVSKVTKKSIGKGIYMSMDTGKTWSLVGAPGAKVFSLTSHPSNPKYVAAACDIAGVWISSGWGFGWEKFTDGIPDSSSVRTIAIPDWPITTDGMTIFAGLYGGGLYKSKPIKTSVIEESDISKISILSVYPQPFFGQVSIIFNNPKDQNLNISITDAIGRTVADFGNKLYKSGSSSFIWEPNNDLMDGVYFFNISSPNEMVSTKLNLIK